MVLNLRPLGLASGFNTGLPCFLHALHYWCRPLTIFFTADPLTFQVFPGFVDDWSMGCHGLPAISVVSNLIHDFEQASGQQINRGKSALIPDRQLSDDERGLLSCTLVQ